MDSKFALTDAERVLFVNPPIYDIRLPWAKYIQPTSLLRLVTLYRRNGANIQFVDATSISDEGHLSKKKQDTLTVDGINLNRWRFGKSAFAIHRLLNKLVKDKWHPDVTYVECMTSFWWQGAAEVIEQIKSLFPTTKVYLVGAYAQCAPSHARANTYADVICSNLWSTIANVPPDLSYLTEKPSLVYVSIGDGTRTHEEIVGEISKIVHDHGVQLFAFSDHAITTRFPALFDSILESLSKLSNPIILNALGNIPLEDIANKPDLALSMHKAGYRQIWFADDRDVATHVDKQLTKQWIENARIAAENCKKAGFRMRTDAITASICIGRPGEDLHERAEFATWMAHHLGSISFWPYQPTVAECNDIALEEQNGKLFPLRSLSNATYTDYLHLLGLASVLNAKYRTQTYDFLGNGLVAQLFRESLTRQAWDPIPEVKGSLKLPAAKR